MQLSFSTAIVALAALAGTVVGETHTVRLNNLCGVGNATLRARNGTILSNGTEYVSNGPLIGAIAYLQNGQCGPAGEHCTAVKTTLRNGIIFLNSSTTFAVQPPYAFSFTAAFSYFNGCDGIGGYCNGPQCPAQDVSVECKDKNVGLSISFCA